MEVRLYDPGIPPKVLEVHGDFLETLKREGGGYVEARGRGVAAWRPLGGTWRLGTLTDEVRAASVKLGFGDPGVLNTQSIRDLHDDGFSVDAIARIVQTV